jgi:hypothetical protein
LRSQNCREGPSARMLDSAAMYNTRRSRRL